MVVTHSPKKIQTNPKVRLLPRTTPMNAVSVQSEGGGDLSRVSRRQRARKLIAATISKPLTFTLQAKKTPWATARR